MNTTSTARAAQTATDRANAEQLDISIISESYRCQYPSKHCKNDRSVKRDGDLHKFCEFHRSKANRNQRKLEQKKKLEGTTPKSAGVSPRQPRRRDSIVSRDSSRRTRASISGEYGANKDDEDALWDMMLPVDLNETDIQALASMIGSSSGDGNAR